MRKIIFMFEHYMYQFFGLKIYFILLPCKVLLLLLLLLLLLFLEFCYLYIF